MGRRHSGMLICFCTALFMALAGYFSDAYIGALSVFFALCMIQRFFGDGSYAIIGPYLAEVWPLRLRGSGMGLCYGVSNVGKIIGPLGLALIVGSSNYISPKVSIDAVLPAFLYLGFWYALSALTFWLIGFETKGRSIEEIDRAFAAGDAAKVPPPAAATAA
jgi:putative MFS transporter